MWVRERFDDSHAKLDTYEDFGRFAGSKWVRAGLNTRHKMSLYCKLVTTVLRDVCMVERIKRQAG